MRGRPAIRLPRVHPRVCGELFFRVGLVGPQDGSSPRVRGTRAPTLTYRGRDPVHPRVCGELPVVCDAASDINGSSPRVRGTPARHGRRPPHRRFIPACAGNSTHTRYPTSAHPVHPRVCGELTAVVNPTTCCAGSSPRVRGTRRAAFSPTSRAAVHPRVCGELGTVASSKTTCSGSSPRVRGTLGERRGRARTHRFIPACAGNSARGCRRGRTSPVHPRVCGELDPANVAAPFTTGSSPRVRGTHAHNSGV